MTEHFEHREEASEQIEPVETVVRETIERLIKESRDTHRCPDFTSISPALVAELTPIIAGHPLLLDKHNDEVFADLFQSLLAKLYALIGLELFDETNRKKRSFMVNVWAGHMANAINNRCARFNEVD